MEHLASDSPLLGSRNIDATSDRRARQRVYFPASMHQDMEAYAKRTKHSVSWCVGLAWSIACAEVGLPKALGEVASSPLLSGRKSRHLVELPMSTWFDVTVEAERLDRSRSWLLQRAWLLARPHLLEALR